MAEVKPRIKPHPIYGWMCVLDTAVGYGRTPARAYDSYMTTWSRQELTRLVQEYRKRCHENC